MNPYQQRVERLLSQMTLDEKLAQIGSCWMYELQADGRLDSERMQSKLKHGIGQITRVAGASTLPPEGAAQACNQIQKFLHQTTRVEFQTLVVELLVAMGYHVAWMAPPEKERGHVDLVVHVDPLGVKGPRIFVQLRQKGQAMTIEGLKSFVSMLGPDHHGLLISTGGFTPELVERVQTDTLLKVTLLDLEGFFDLWIRYYQQLSEEAHRHLPLKAVYFLYANH